MKFATLLWLVFASAVAHAGDATIPCTLGVKGTDGVAVIKDTAGAVITDVTVVRYAFGKNKDALVSTKDATVKADGSCNYSFSGLDAGVWYFSARAVRKSGLESALSNVVSKTIAAPALPSQAPALGTPQ